MEMKATVMAIEVEVEMEGAVDSKEEDPIDQMDLSGPGACARAPGSRGCLVPRPTYDVITLVIIQYNQIIT